MLNLDTHVLLHALSGSISAKERALLTKQSWSISAIVLWEIAKLSELGRIDVELADLVTPLRTIHIWPITLDVCRRRAQLDFKSDPADEIIAATSLLHTLPLVTRDRKIRRSRVVPLALS